MMDILRIDTADSTNTWLTQHEKEIAETVLVYCDCQTAGRGQRGNSWESEPGKNITASIIFHPKDFPANLQFRISEAVSLAIIDFLKHYGVEAKIKWPNDVYVGDKKICGILVEHVVTGMNISRCIAGIGININQKKFKSDAPNPVSLIQLTGKENDIHEGVKLLGKCLEKNIISLGTEVDSIFHSEFISSLWRKDNKYHSFKDRKKDEIIEAYILDVGPDGFLTLVKKDGERRKYAFKEVEYIL